jgi:hypothetical protein
MKRERLRKGYLARHGEWKWHKITWKSPFGLPAKLGWGDRLYNARSEEKIMLKKAVRYEDDTAFINRRRRWYGWWW